MSLFSWLKGAPKPTERELEIGDHIMFVRFIGAHGLAGILWSQPQTGTVISFSDTQRSVLIDTKPFGEQWFLRGRIKVVDWLPPANHHVPREAG